MENLREGTIERKIIVQIRHREPSAVLRGQRTRQLLHDLGPIFRAPIPVSDLLGDALTEKPVPLHKKQIDSLISIPLSRLYDSFRIRHQIVRSMIGDPHEFFRHHSTFLCVWGLYVSKICSKLAITLSFAMPLSRKTA